MSFKNLINCFLKINGMIFFEIRRNPFKRMKDNRKKNLRILTIAIAEQPDPNASIPYPFECYEFKEKTLRVKYLEDLKIETYEEYMEVMKGKSRLPFELLPEHLEPLREHPELYACYVGMFENDDMESYEDSDTDMESYDDCSTPSSLSSNSDDE